MKLQKLPQKQFNVTTLKEQETQTIQNEKKKTARKITSSVKTESINRVNTI